MPHFWLKKMDTEYSEPINYFLTDKNNQLFKLNDLLGKKISILFENQINCIKCGKKINKTYGSGFCYDCFSTAPEADVCVLQPEKCQAHKGISRDIEWSKTHCLRPHYVYLAKTNNIKVGVTRQSQIPTRWIDQGADSAIKLAKTPYRKLAGDIEVEMKKHFTDKTSWQNMLKNISTEKDLLEYKKMAIEYMPEEFKKYIINDDYIWEMRYPSKYFPEKVHSLKLDKQPEFEGKLIAIKGQYLIFNNFFVLNIRSHTGYNITLNF